jgi:hypothetical protein
MRCVYNGMPATDVAGRWIKSGRSGAQGNCVELAFVDVSRVVVRDSKEPDGSALVFEAAQFEAFVRWVKHGIS